MRKKGGSLLWAAFFVAITAETFGVAWYLRQRYTRYVVAGESMLPAYRPGDFLLVDTWAYRRRSPAAGEVVLSRDPRYPSRVLLKRIAGVNPDGALELAGDHAAASTDSRDFGPVPPELVVGKVVRRYWPLR
jgi:nickel-type superoxide dismutase maturation protease